jgi:predicted transcriptional regulator
LTNSVHFVVAEQISGAVATRQTSSSGRPKSPRIQVVLPEDLCERLSALAETESRTVSNMAKVLIQQGVERLERQQGQDEEPSSGTDRFRRVLEQQQRDSPRRLRGAPRRLRLQRPRG